ncbi:hypothetical protein DFO70_104400 [Cytobacillus firmus]|uniref:Uncharacterized protein n=2 Tax=Cytobacillus TaxID=2675230 RepID=A0A366K0I0_CYTFI|nr:MULTISPECIES: hypothetical protein [Cytobacillus]RBP94757.1 hypothetical protein DFO70_104400 [Cytobacillus firmus]TDX43502.1 hypothetical protein DFO72_105401 [Cytobacillus oceanisediminis]
MEEHHPHLVWKDWKVDVRSLSANDIRNEEIKASVPNEFQGELTCWVFLYDGGVSNVVYLLQDKQGLQDLGIGLLKGDELIKPICFV